MTTSNPCAICGNNGQIIHAKLTDRLSSTPGTWNLLECDNKACGLIWIDPMPSVDTLRQAYDSYYTHATLAKPTLLRRLYNRCRIGYLVSNFAYPKELANGIEKLLGRVLAMLPHRRAALDASIMWVPWIENGKVLEIGCGNGDRLALLKELGWQTLGIEPDLSAAKIASARGLEIINQLFDEDMIAEASMDVVLLCHVIEHLPNPRNTLKECLRILKPGGRLIMLTPNTQSFGHKKYGPDWLHLDPPRHLNLFNSDNLTQLLTDNGFKDPICSTSIRDANWTLSGSQALKKRNSYQIGKLPFTEQLFGLFMLYLEWASIKASPTQGEDLLCIVKKKLTTAPSSS